MSYSFVFLASARVIYEAKGAMVPGQMFSALRPQNHEQAMERHAKFRIFQLESPAVDLGPDAGVAGSERSVRTGVLPQPEGPRYEFKEEVGNLTGLLKNLSIFLFLYSKN